MDISNCYYLNLTVVTGRSGKKLIKLSLITSNSSWFLNIDSFCYEVVISLTSSISFSGSKLTRVYALGLLQLRRTARCHP